MSILVRAAALAFSALALVAASAPTAFADSPVVITPYSFEFSEQDALMTEACGFPVQATIVVSGIDRDFEPWPGGLVYLGTGRTNVILTSETNTVTFRERLQERAQQTREGTFTFSYTGRSFGTDSIGRLVLDLSTGEVAFQAGTAVNYAALCAVLSA